MIGKYGNIPTIIGDIKFDSKFEANVFRVLRDATYSNPELSVEVKPGVIVRPKTNYFSQRSWACDFRLNWHTIGHLNIEAKGIPLPEYRIVLETLESNYPLEFDRTITVLSDWDNLKPWLSPLRDAGKVISLTQLARKIHDRDYWNKHCHI